jgi:uncharacterized protein (TIGR02118 family)
MICVTVVYPNTPGTRFDRSYYTERHMPMANARFGPFGLKKAEILSGKPGLDGSAAAYHMMANLYFDSMEKMQDGLAKVGGEVMADIPNYTNTQPVIYVGEVAG